MSVIDWGFSGYMPYALDAARMIAHGVRNPTEENFDFVMSDDDKELFLQTYYERIHLPLSEHEYRQDIFLAKLNEYVEFIEEDLLTDNPGVRETFYYKAAMDAAFQILQTK